MAASRNYRVLVVDDNPDLLASMRFALQAVGNYEVETAAKGMEGLERTVALIRWTESSDAAGEGTAFHIRLPVPSFGKRAASSLPLESHAGDQMPEPVPTAGR